MAECRAVDDKDLNVFISYSRKDLSAAEGLRDRLIADGFSAHLDQHDILPGEPWQDRLAALIRTADSVVFLLSPDSVASPICDWEVNEAERLGKRILPVVIRDPDPDTVPGRLKRLNYIFLRGTTEAETGLARLSAALLTDIQWVREHTRLGVLAADWDRASHATELLLRGSALSAAELWVSQPASGGLTPTELHRAFIAAGRKGEQARTEAEREQLARTRRFQKRAGWALVGVAMVLISMLVNVLWQQYNTTRREQSVFTGLAAVALDNEEFDRAMRYSLQAYPARGSIPFLSPFSIELEAKLAGAAQSILLRRVLALHSKALSTASFSPDGRRIVTASLDNTARVWDAESGTAIAVLKGHDDGVNSASFSPDGRRIVTASDDNSARVWDAKSGKSIAVLTGHNGAVTSASFSPDGRRVLTASYSDKTARVWDVENGTSMNGTSIAVLNGHDSFLKSASFSPDGRRIVTASEDTTARVWDVESGISVLNGHDASLSSALFSPDGRRIVTASSDQTARVWDAESKISIAVLKGHDSFLRSASFSPDGRRIVTASFDNTARVWDAESGTAIAVLKGHDNGVNSASFSPDGRRIVTASDDHTARCGTRRAEQRSPYLRAMMTRCGPRCSARMVGGS
jgi:WD40 repeat protein